MTMSYDDLGNEHSSMWRFQNDANKWLQRTGPHQGKCIWLRKNRFGGVMIWAYDTDIKLSHRASLARAVYSVLKQKKRNSTQKGK